MRVLLWFGVVLAIPAFAVALFLVRHKNPSVHYWLDKPSGRYVKVTRIYEDSWQAAAARPLVSYLGPIFDWDEADHRDGTVSAAEVPGLGDPVVRRVLAGLANYEARCVEEESGAELDERRRLQLGLARRYQIAMVIAISSFHTSNHNEDFVFAFDRAHRLIVQSTVVRETGEETIDTFVPGEVPHRTRVQALAKPRPTATSAPLGAPR